MERETATKFIHELLDLLVKQNGSDLFITAGFPPALKIDGKIAPVSKTPLTPQHTIEIVRSVMNDKQAAEFESTKECNFAISPPGIGRFRCNAFVQMGRVGMAMRTINTNIPTFDELAPAARAQGCHDEQARHHDVHRRDGRRQVDVDGRAARIPQREQLRPHHHDRGPDRIRARAQELHHHPARSRRRHRQLGHRAQEHAAAGTRRHPHRRSSRPRHDGLRDRVCRDGPPVPGDAAREQHQPGAGPDHQLLPGRAAPAAAHGPCRSTSAPSSRSG